MTNSTIGKSNNNSSYDRIRQLSQYKNEITPKTRGTHYTLKKTFSDIKLSPINNNSNMLSAGVIGLSALALAGIILGRGKNIKSLFNNVKSQNIQRAANNLPNNIKLNNVEEAQVYFDRLGIRTILKKGTERHLDDLNAIKDDLVTLQRNGVQMSKPNTIVFSNWRKKSEIEEVCRQLNMPEEAVSHITQTLNGASGMWGSVQSLKNGNNIVFINNGSTVNLKKFIHEMGHLHQDTGTSYWHYRGFTGPEFLRKQCEILGLPECVNIKQLKNWSNENLYDIFRTNCSNQASIDGLRQRIQRTFPELNGNYETLFFYPLRTASGKIEPYYINGKRMVEKMYSESRVYAPDRTYENVAEIFEGLNKGQKYSDEVMLIYDFCGGGRVPNLVIKGKKYDDYIASLYENKDLIQRLKSLLDIRKLES